MENEKSENKVLFEQKKAKLNALKKSFLSLKNVKAKMSLKKVGRSRTQKGHKNY